jgi:hypothetical protein
MRRYVETRTLPACVKTVLESYGFRRDSVAVEPSETFTVQAVCAYEGSRAFTAVVALDGSGSKVESIGSWGGANPFEARPVDTDDRKRPLPPGYVVIQGESGARGAFATLLAHPETFAPLLGAGPAHELSADEKTALLVIKGYKPFARKEFFERKRWSAERLESTLSSLAQKGLVSRNKAGATKITTEGRNACGDERTPY